MILTGQTVFSSLRWMAAGRFAGQLVTWVITILVMRLLAPQDYGLLAMAMVVIGLLTLFEELGLGAALVQERELADELAGSIFALLIVFDLALYAILFVSAPAMAAFFGEPLLVDLIRVIALQLPLQAFGVVPDSILSRRMAFRNKSLVQFVAAVSGSALTLALAWRGLGVWSLVYGNLTTAVVRVVGLNIAARYWVMPRWSAERIGHAIRFGGLVTVDRLLWYAYSQSDVFIIGRLLGKEVLGFYSVAMHLAALPMRKIAGMLNEVGFSAFSRIQDEPERVSANLCKAARMLSFIAFPLFFGISSVAPEIVGVFLVERWTPAIVPIQILSLMVPLRMLNTVMPTSLYGVGRAKVSVGNSAIACLLMPTAFLIGVQYGLAGVCIAWLIAFPISFLITLSRALPVLGVPLRKYLSGMLGPLLGSALMYLVVTGVRTLLLMYAVPGPVQLLLLIVSGAITYIVFMTLFYYSECREMLDLVRPADAGPNSGRLWMILKALIPRPIKSAISKQLRKRRLYVAFDSIQALPPDQPIPQHLLEEVHYGWGNAGWSADTTYLAEVCQRIQATDAPVLECGSGLTTLLAGILRRGKPAQVWTLEHNADWHAHLRMNLDRLGIDSVELCHAPLQDYDGYSWYSPPLKRMPAKFGVIICDGPPDSTPGGRYGLMPVMRGRIASDCIILVDDTERENEKSMLERWEREHDTAMQMDWSANSYVVCRVS